MSETITLGETRRRISYDLRVVEFVSPAENLVIVEHPADGRRFVHTYDEVAAWPVVVPAGTGFRCPVDGILPTSTHKDGSVSPVCVRCGRFVVQVEATDGEVF